VSLVRQTRGNSREMVIGMLVMSAGKWRQRAAAVLVAVYALCLVAPVTAFAFSDVSAPCLALTDDHHGIGESHHHQHGVDQQKSSHDGDNHPGKCCGLFCVTAIAPPAFGVAEMQLVQASAVAMPAVAYLSGRNASRIDRPPRSVLSL
jgi:hypothetical protein